MSTGRGRRVRFPDAADMPDSATAVSGIGPIVVTARFQGQDVPFDLSDLPCPRLVRHLAQAVAERIGDNGPQRSRSTAENTVGQVREFVQFAATALPGSGGEVDLGDVTPELLESYELHLLAHHREKSDRPYSKMANIVRLLRAAARASPHAFGPAMQRRLDFATISARSAINPLNAYPVPVFEAIEAAALADVRQIRDRMLEGERLAQLGQDPSVAGWDQLENVLWHMANRGPLTRADLARPERRDHLKALGGFRIINRWLFLTGLDLVAFMALLICQTGLEPDCVRRLRADCLINPGRGFVSIAYTKRRARRSASKRIRVGDGGALHFPGGLVRLAQRLTESGRTLAGSDFLWVDVGDHGVRSSFASQRSLGMEGAAWLASHQLDGLSDYAGAAVRLDLRRLRKNYKSRRYIQTSGALDEFAEGHTKAVAALRRHRSAPRPA